MTPAGFPAGAWAITAARCFFKKSAYNHVVGRYPGWRNALQRLPRRLFKAPSGMCVEGESVAIRPLTVAGAAQARCIPYGGATFLLPVELQHVNHAASTNSAGFYGALGAQPYNRKLYDLLAPPAPH